MAGNTERATYLIVLKQHVVAQDLAEAIAEHLPGAIVIRAAGAEEAERMMAGLAAPVALAFLGIAPAQLAASGLGAQVAASGGRIVLMGQDAEQHGETEAWWVLERPFTSDSVYMLLDRAGVLKGTGAA